MTEAAERVAKLIRKSDRTPWGPECGAILAEAVSVADAAGEEQYAYAARMRQCMNASLANDYELLLATFAVCERMHTADPVTFPAHPEDMGPPGAGYGYADLYWMWKWIPTALIDSPDFPAEAVEESIDELDAAYDRVGSGRKAVAQRRLRWAIERGLPEEAARVSDELAALPDDDYSDCPACSRSRLIEARLLLGDEAGALVLLDEIAEGNFGCADEPAVAYSHLLDALARSGSLHRVTQGVEQILENGSAAEGAGATARLVIFLTRCGQTGRALSLARRTLARITDAPLDVAGHETLLAAVAVACRASAAEGNADAPIPEADVPGLARYLGREDGGHTVGSLATAADAAARSIAAAFDRRNGTSAHSERMAEQLAEGVHYDIALALPVDPESAFAEETVGAESLFRIDDALPPEPADTDEAIQAVFNLTHFGRPREGLELGRRWLPRVEVPMDRALLLHRLAVALVDAEPGADASDLAAESLDALRQAGHADVADALAVLGSAYYTDPAPGEFEAIRASIAGLLASGMDRSLVGYVVTFVPQVYAEPQLMDAAMALMAQADVVTQRLGRPTVWSHRAVGGRINLLSYLGIEDPEQLAPLLAELAEPLPDRTRLAQLEDEAAIAAASGYHARALEARLEAFKLAVRWGAAPFRAATALRLADSAEASGRTAEVLAVGSFIERLAPGLAPEDAARFLMHAASCEDGVGEPAAAMAHLEAARTALLVAAEPDQRLLGLTLRAMGWHHANAHHDREAAAEFLAAAEALENAGQSDDAADAALFSAYAELRLGNIVAAGQLAEAVLGLLPGLEKPWGVEMSARHVIADAAARAGSDAVSAEVVEESYAAALAVAARAPEPETAETSRMRVLLSLAKWREESGNLGPAVDAAREALAIAEKLGQAERVESALITLGWALGQQGSEEARAEASDVVARLMGNPETSEDGRGSAERLSRRLARAEE